MKKTITLCLLVACFGQVMGQKVLSLDSCRNMAIRNNKQIRIADEKIKAAGYDKKSAFANYLPGIDVMGTYLYSSKEISLLNDKQKAELSNLGTNLQGQAQNVLGPIIAANPQLAQILSPLLGIDIAGPLNGIGTSIVDAFRTDNTNLFAGAVTLTQPIYMGGKIRAYNQITKYAEELALSQKNTALKDIIFRVDEAYWQVVSLVYKEKLAVSYVNLLDTLNKNVEAMIEEGVATKSDGLTVAVKLNEAQITLTKVEDGLSLSKMVLAQLCGLPIDLQYSLADENMVPVAETKVPVFNMDEVYANRSEIKSLTLATEIYRKKQNVVRSEMLPNVALTGSYLISNPNLLNGFSKKFDGLFNVGVMVKIPIFHWGKNYYKLQSAKAERNIAMLELSDAKEMIELQVNQAAFKVTEANKKLDMTRRNMEKAEENLRNAQLGFEEGVLTTDNLLEAQTAWLQAQSEKIDAEIDVRLCNVYLEKATGMLK